MLTYADNKETLALSPAPSRAQAAAADRRRRLGRRLEALCLTPYAACLIPYALCLLAYNRLLRRIGDGGSGGGSKLLLPRCVLGLDFICASLTLLAQVEPRTKACRIRLTKPYASVLGLEF
jgi:hypothetical protein